MSSDCVVLAIPFTTLRDVDLEGAVRSGERCAREVLGPTAAALQTAAAFA